MTVPDWHEAPIAKVHDRKGFDCGEANLNDFLMRHARQAHESGASKTYVALDSADKKTILGYYTLSPAQIDFDAVPGSARPAGAGRHAIGGFRLGRLAVRKSCQGKGLGGELLIAAARRCIRVSVEVGGTLLFIDAKDERAAEWYRTYGAVPIPRAPLSLVLPYSVFAAALEQAGKPIV
ncbi:GNAT family N-acetyltransferase [Neoaquamicrobium sediminum]|uniref:GNAT family N-acetyltransferase n=1 Tax=Neoaquamicrobium sediminum TaxID=1849104 RepID=UPI001564E62F|nr:GNAT family N-acetyltransferase [Mesorhizobium sediminum]NRC57311.1 GNAT family N-acetyltransferase [Mesorhizobium sediminum]